MSSKRKKNKKSILYSIIKLFWLSWLWLRLSQRSEIEDVERLLFWRIILSFFESVFLQWFYLCSSCYWSHKTDSVILKQQSHLLLCAFTCFEIFDWSTYQNFHVVLQLMMLHQLTRTSSVNSWIEQISQDQTASHHLRQNSTLFNS